MRIQMEFVGSPKKLFIGATVEVRGLMNAATAKARAENVIRESSSLTEVLVQPTGFHDQHGEGGEQSNMPPTLTLMVAIPPDHLKRGPKVNDDFWRSVSSLALAVREKLQH